jgi:hypothetical protein
MVVGHLYDRFGSYQPRFIVGLAGVALLAAFLSLLLRGDRSIQHTSLKKLIPVEGPLEE